MTFGNKLSSLRKQANLTQNDLAEKLNVSRQAITKWENDVGLPDVDNLKNISKIFGVSIDELLECKTETVELNLEYKKEDVNDEKIKWNTANDFILKRFYKADSIYLLQRELRLGFWGEIMDFFIGAGTLNLADTDDGLLYVSRNPIDYVSALAILTSSTYVWSVHTNSNKMFVVSLYTPLDTNAYSIATAASSLLGSPGAIQHLANRPGYFSHYHPGARYTATSHPHSFYGEPCV